MSRCLKALCRDLIAGEKDWLLLFDIDGTLLDAGGKGLKALQLSAEEIFGSKCPQLDLAGATDLGVLDYLTRHFQIKPNPELTRNFFETYHFHLKRCLKEESNLGRVMDGVIEVLEIFSRNESSCIGLLTGNTMTGAGIKLSHFSLEKYFTFGAYGSDHADRNQLGFVALDRVKAKIGRSYRPEQILVIGDTPKDIACAHSLGASCLAVATGKFSEKELLDARADWVAASLLEILKEFPETCKSAT